jgi:hypothetical protein
MKEYRDLTKLIAGIDAGTKIELEVIRGGKVRVLDVTIGSMPGEDLAMAKPGEAAAEDGPRIGLLLTPLTPEVREKRGLDDAPRRAGGSGGARQPGATRRHQGRQRDLHGRAGARDRTRTTSPAPCARPRIRTARRSCCGWSRTASSASSPCPSPDLDLTSARSRSPAASGPGQTLSLPLLTSDARPDHRRRRAARGLPDKALREIGATVDHAADGREGLLLAAGNDYDVLVIDRMLPSLEGSASCARCGPPATRRRS